jgi:hypothetical protein
MVSPDPDDQRDNDVDELLPEVGRERDGVSSLRDVQEESGDEAGVHDAYDLDEREAQDLGIRLDSREEPEPHLE